MKQVKQKLLFALTILLISSSSVLSEEILLAKYDFSTKSKVPVEQAAGVTFGSEFGVYNENQLFPMEMSITDDGYLLVRGYSEGIAHNRYGYISITPEGGKTIRITKVIINHTLEAGSNTMRTRCFLYDTGGDQPIANPTILADLIYKGTGGLTIPTILTEQTILPTVAADFSSVKFMSFYSTQIKKDVADLAQWKIRSLTFYGEIIAQGDIISTKAIDFGTVFSGNEVDGAVSMKVVGGATKNVNIELIDPSNSFTCFQFEVEPIDATAGTIINVSYAPTTPGTHIAQLKLSYDDKVAYTQLSGICPVLNENFTHHISDPMIWAEMDGTMANSHNLDEITTIPGWMINDGVNWHLSGLYGLGLELRGSQAEAPRATTPELDLSAPFGISFRSKKTANRPTLFGDMYVTAGEDTIYSFVNQNTTLDVRSAIGFIGKANSKISFVGMENDSNRFVVDEISIFPTNAPTLTLPSYSTKAINVIAEPVTIEIPFTAYQLTGDITVALTGTPAGYDLLTPTIAKSVAEAGATIQVKFTPPTEGIAANAELKVQGGGLSSIRSIQLIASSATGISENRINAKIYPKNGSICAVVDGTSTLEVYSYDSKKVYKKQMTTSAEVKVSTGLYIVRVTNAEGCRVEKVFVN